MTDHACLFRPIPILALGLALQGAGCGRMGLDAWVQGEDTSDGPPFGGDTEIDDTNDTNVDTGDPGGGSGGGTGGGTGGSTGGSSGGGSGGGDGGGDGGGSTEHSPVLDDFDVVGGDGSLDVTFVASDADGDLIGGTFDFIIDSDLESYSIPNELDSWTEGGTSRLSVPVPVGDCDSESFNLAARVHDAAGNQSSTLTTSATVAGSGTSLTDSGDESTTATNVGTVAKGDLLCGALSSVANDGAAYTGDYDWVRFKPDSSGSWNVDLSWTASGSDYDLYLFQSSGAQMDSATTYSNTPPETVSATLNPASEYYLLVVGWSGSPGDYSLKFR